MLRKLFWNGVRKIAGWKIEGFDINSIPQAVITVAPHTSGWDVIVGLFTRGSQGSDIRFLGKHTLFKPPHGFIFKWLGGMPVDRTKSTHLVDTVANYFRVHKELKIAIAPEGTRKKVDSLKSGFYYMAKKANVPIVMAKFDYEHKTMTYSEPFMPGDDVDAVLKKVWDYYKGVKGYVPEYSIE